jgi:hypothetical protein
VRLQRAIRCLLLLHIALQIRVLRMKLGPSLQTDFALQLFQAVFMATLWYTAWVRHRRDPGSLQKRLIHYAFLTWILRLYVKLLSPALADMLSLAVVWLFVRSQWHTLNVPERVRERADMFLVISESLLFLFGLLQTVNPGVVQNKAHTVVFTLSHLVFIAMAFVLFVRAAVISRDPTVKYRFALLMGAAALYTGVFMFDFVWRSFAPGLSGNRPVVLKHLFDTLGMLSLYAAFNMGDRLRSFILTWHRSSTGMAELRLISLVLHISEAAARERSHILPSLALRVAERLKASETQKSVIAQAGALLAIVHRHELPDMTEQWYLPTSASGKTTPRPLPVGRRPSPFEERLEDLVQVQVVLEAVDLPYHMHGERGRLESDILRVVLAYLESGDLQAVLEQRGTGFSPQAVDALLVEVGHPMPSRTSW